MSIIKRLIFKFPALAPVILIVLGSVFLLNGIAYRAILIGQGYWGPLAKYIPQSVLISYPDMAQDEVALLLRETLCIPFTHEPFVQFREEPFHGKYGI